MSLNLKHLRRQKHQTLVLGNHPFIIQSMLDFDFLSGIKEPSVKAILASTDGYAKYFWGRGEVLIPVHKDLASVPSLDRITLFLNLLSGRRTLATGLELLENLPRLQVGVIFAEGVPERHALELASSARSNNVTLIGPASVGLVVPGALKLGPIGGVTLDQIEDSNITRPGNFAVLSASGGMTNELINIVAQNDHNLSFALSFGGDRFPILEPVDAFLLAESDPQTKHILYYGELGGTDEYKLIELKNQGRLKKNFIIHIAGTVADLFPESPQFGHAKAKAVTELEKASAKREALENAGFTVSTSFADFAGLVKSVK